VKGWLKIEPFTESPESLRGFADWYFGKGEPDDSWKLIRVVESASHSGNVVARLEGCSDRDAALEYRSMRVAVPRSALPAPKKDEYYQADLVGLTVKNMQGEELGKVAGLFSNGAHDVLRISKPDGGEQLVPLVPQYLREIDLKGEIIRVDWGLDW
jgi:16S rRNA processing protein RimM